MQRLYQHGKHDHCHHCLYFLLRSEMPHRTFQVPFIPAEVVLEDSLCFGLWRQNVKITRLLPALESNLNTQILWLKLLLMFKCSDLWISHSCSMADSTLIITFCKIKSTLNANSVINYGVLELTVNRKCFCSPKLTMWPNCPIIAI